MTNKGQLFSANLDQIDFEDIVAFCGLKVPENQRVKEGLRVDYKTEIPKDLGKTITGFANSSGGLIFVGITEKDGIPQTAEGITLGPGDIKTTVTNIAYTTIDSPIIPEVGFCKLDNDPNKAVVVIRVPMSRDTPHMYIKGEENCIYVRVNDRQISANLSMIKALFQRKELITSEAGAILSSERIRVNLKNDQRAFRAISIIPEFPTKDLIPFNGQTDQYFLRTSPLKFGNHILDRDGIMFRVKDKMTDQEQWLSISERGIFHYCGIVGEDEFFKRDSQLVQGISVSRTIDILKIVLAYAQEALNNFGYFGKIHICLSLGRIEGYFLTSDSILGAMLGAVPITRGLAGSPVTARIPNISVDRLLKLDEIKTLSSSHVKSIIQEIARGAFGHNLDDHYLNQYLTS